MVTGTVSSECIALILGKKELGNIRGTVERSLFRAGYAPWPAVEAEIYEYRDCCLLLARPRSPLPMRGTYRKKRRH